MVHFCAVHGCGSRSNRERNLSYFRIPKVRRMDGEKKQELKSKQQRMWLANINRADIKVEKLNDDNNYRVCSEHFIEGMFLFSVST